MAHKTLIGGTAYEISGGKTLVDGAAYSIKSGKTLVDGTVYDIELAKMATLTIGNFTTTHYSISVDGVVYNDTTLTVPVGTIVKIEVFDIYGNCKHHDSNVSIYVNDNCVMDNKGDATYSHTVTGDTELSNEMYYNTCRDCYSYYYQYNVYITEQ